MDMSKENEMRLTAEENAFSDVICKINNIQGKFIQYYCANALNRIYEELFSKSADAYMKIPAFSNPVNGFSEIKNELIKLEKKRNGGNAAEFHMLHSPACVVSEDGISAKATWDTYSYEYDNNTLKIQFYITRVDARFIIDDGKWRYERLDWYEMMSMLPWTVEKTEYDFTNIFKMKLPSKSVNLKNIAEDYLNIRNLQGFFSTNNRRDFLKLFAEDKDTTFEFPGLINDICIGREEITNAFKQLEIKEASSGGKYVYVPIITSPVIEISEDKNSAEGFWFGQTIEISMAAQVVRRLGVFNQKFIKKEGEWKIKHFCFSPLFNIPEEPYREEIRYHRMKLKNDNWLYDKFPGNLGNPEDIFTVENIFNEWICSIRRGEIHQYVVNHMYNNHVPFKLDIRSKGKDSICLKTREGISERLLGMDNLHIHKQISYHSTTTPVLSMSEDGNNLYAIWIDHSLTNLGSANGEKSSVVPYMVLLSKYIHEFTKINGVWHHTSFEWEPLISLPDMMYDCSKSRGWCGSDEQYKYPRSLELLNI